ncbi:MAG: exopolysaccharide biosynthesis polyprenyl glycosylphosphotransferase, partial [Pseudobdellovibrionaceae bacterium]
QLMLARFEANRVRDLVQFYEETWQKVPLFYLGSRWFLLTEGFHLLGNPIRLRLKRLMDVTISLFILLITVPIMLVTAVWIRLDSPGPVIYRQTRTGRDGKDFVIYKFRSMRTDAEKDGAKWASENDSRVTRIGNFIRKTRIDELPQLFNILKGSMSFVGPRPERPEFNTSLEKELSFYNLRHMVQPGLTGWAQVLYPYGASLEDAKEKLQYDLYYIKNYSLWLDISIVLKTITVVFFGRGR